MLDLLISTTVHGLILGIIYSTIAMGMSLIFGVMGIKNLAHGDFAVLGMFTTYFLFGYLMSSFGIPPSLLSFALSFVVVFILFFVIGMTLTRFIFKHLIGEMLGSIILTFGVSIFMENVMLLVWGGDYRIIDIPYETYRLGPVSVNGAYLVAFVVTLALIISTQLFLSKTKLGIAIRAVSQDVDAAESLGISSDTIRLVGGGLGIALAGCGGTILAIIYYIYPYLGILLTLYAMIICVLAGLGNVLGAFFGGIIIGVAQSVATIWIPYALTPAVGFALFVLILIFKPKGLFTRG
ncbi:MAG: branched-chain amino acid ABC transporter permease [Candidatus Bathyarchaeia archaeon]|nr:branched-chain amino acid ABC transporter permease [Candidatus Bathyarchaeota archaeon]